MFQEKYTSENKWITISHGIQELGFVLSKTRQLNLYAVRNPLNTNTLFIKLLPDSL